MLSIASLALFGIRKAKSDSKLSMKAEITSAKISSTKDQLPMLQLVSSDLKSVGRIEVLEFVVGPEVLVSDVVFQEISE